MILIRGIKGERYARDIERGVVGCRDVLSTLFSPFKTGYSFSDYLEKNLITAITQCVGRKARDFKNPSMLCSILSFFLITLMVSLYCVTSVLLHRLAVQVADFLRYIGRREDLHPTAT